MNTDKLVQSLGGMSPQQAQAATKMIGSALMQKQKQEGTAQYRQDRLDLQKQKQEDIAQYRQQQINIYEDREERLRQSAKAEHEMNVRKQNNQMKRLAIDARLKKMRYEESSAQRKLLMEKRSKIEKEQEALDNLNTEVPIPGVEGEKIKLGTAVRVGILSDILENSLNAKGASIADLPANYQNIVLLEQRGKTFDEAARMVYGSDVNMSDILKVTAMLVKAEPDEVRKTIKSSKEILAEARDDQVTRTGQGGLRRKDPSNVTLNLEVPDKNPGY